MDPVNTSPTTEPAYETIGDALDWLEIIAGKIGMIKPEQGFELLRGLDTVHTRMQELEPENPSLRIYQAQFGAIVAKMRKEASRFLRDLGGAQALRQARAEVKPPQDHWWWYLDEWLAAQRQAAVKRSLIIAGAVVVALILLAVIYNRFLAPDPREMARYGHEQTARDMMMRGELQAALDEVNKGLQIPPVDPALLVLKGVIQESMGQTAEAEQTYGQARAVINNVEEFHLERGTDYVQVNQVEKALADAQTAIQANPDSGQAYLLLGQVYEIQRKYQEALDIYNKAYEAAGKSDQIELAALARMRLAMLMQTINSQLPMEMPVTPTP